MTPVKWVSATAATRSMPPAATLQRATLQDLIWTAMFRARREREAEAAEALQDILDTMDAAAPASPDADPPGVWFHA